MTPTDASDSPTVPSFHMADLWEAVVDHLPDAAERTGLVCGDQRRTYAQLEDHANRLAHHLRSRGVGPGDRVAIHSANCAEYVEAMLAAFKLRAVPVNVNHRYVADELRYLYADCGAEVAFVAAELVPLVAEVAPDLDDLRSVVVIDDGSGTALPASGSPAAGELELVAFADALAGGDPRRDFGPRSGDDLYMIYTGGTTGMPKGVVWTQEAAFFACVGGGDPMRLAGPISSPDQIVERIIGGPFVFFPLAPLMHAAAQWTTFSWLLGGGTALLHPGSLDPAVVWETASREGANAMVLIGDAVARPMLDEWDRHGGYEVPSLLGLSNGGAPISPALRDRLLATFPSISFTDGFGSSETGAQGAQRVTAADKVEGGTQFVPMGDSTCVLDETTLEPVEAGSDQVGRVARRGHIPLRYHNDPAKTAETFVEHAGERWVLTGDLARVLADGTIALLGRGSGCINTGGEKVFAEEVEAALKSHPQVYDAVVVGVPDERWGQAVAAVVQPPPGTAPAEVDPESIRVHCRAHLAGYKVPKRIEVVPLVERSPAGKADYRWARARFDEPPTEPATERGERPASEGA